ncbi:nitric-oxide reductase large subunit [Haemophilus parainfluenzae]|uniref:nitric-oxide reductase large subunit n=1 Tax=Haemophilus parainfluenzae TaxID=729 RepID=UPI000803162B|nr:nitric-oxide reductase large subunit [Haemophilus parainfluenzae]OBX69728.1 nitric oxide reductase large subunit [Haemophilus parainfluenzae]
MGQYKKFWYLLVAVLIGAFSILGYYGFEVYREAPPIPQQYVSESGEKVITHDDILHGQTAWQTTGGMQVGSVWGHGAYQAPDWTADWLHRELTNWLDITANQEFGKNFADLNDEQQTLLKARLTKEYRGSKVENGTVVLSNTRLAAMEKTAQYYISLYGDDPATKVTREHFAMKDNTLPDLQARKDLAKFFFWTAWTASAERPNTHASYTNNWPHEPLINNMPTPENVIWSIASVVFLIAGIGFVVWIWSFKKREDEKEPATPEFDPLTKLQLTPSQRSLGKYLFTVLALFVLQVTLGAVVAHCTVEGQEFYGIDISQYFPYSLVRTWHIQAALFWIAMAFLAGGLFLAPIINGGKDPKFQKLGVDVLYWALVVLVVGSFTGSYLAIAHILPEEWSFMFGHQGYEFIDLGRFWQAVKFAGILFWLVLMLRGTVNAFKQPGDKNLLALFFASVIAIGLFYGPALFYGEHTHISVMEYWRWWVVHLWVEGFFEVFSVAALSFIFVSLGLVSRRTATVATITEAALFLIGGIPGTFHHLYFAGATTPIIAVGASFSALEVVPLVLLGHEAWEHWAMKQKAPWMERLKWPLYCFVAVAFWNMLGAGVFGFLINPPISLYYIQGLNTTAVHAHAALFGVYGFLALGFVFLIARYLRPDTPFNDKLMKWGFWLLNGGLVLMIVSSLLPIGIIQGYASISEGLWYARSEEFMQQPLFDTLRWVRFGGDVVFIFGALAFFWQIFTMIFFKPKKAA